VHKKRTFKLLGRELRAVERSKMDLILGVLGCAVVEAVARVTTSAATGEPLWGHSSSTTRSDARNAWRASM
jgi:hypothetical protein